MADELLDQIPDEGTTDEPTAQTDASVGAEQAPAVPKYHLGMSLDGIDDPAVLREIISQADRVARDQQNMIRSQSNEVGDARKAIDALTQRFEQFSQPPAPPVPQEPSPDEVYEKELKGKFVTLARQFGLEPDPSTGMYDEDDTRFQMAASLADTHAATQRELAQMRTQYGTLTRTFAQQAGDSVYLGDLQAVAQQAGVAAIPENVKTEALAILRREDPLQWQQMPAAQRLAVTEIVLDAAYGRAARTGAMQAPPAHEVLPTAPVGGGARQARAAVNPDVEARAMAMDPRIKIERRRQLVAEIMSQRGNG